MQPNGHRSHGAASLKRGCRGMEVLQRQNGCHFKTDWRRCMHPQQMATRNRGRGARCGSTRSRRRMEHALWRRREASSHQTQDDKKNRKLIPKAFKKCRVLGFEQIFSSLGKCSTLSKTPKAGSTPLSRRIRLSLTKPKHRPQKLIKVREFLRVTIRHHHHPLMMF